MRYYKCHNGHKWKFPEQNCPECGEGWAMTFRADDGAEDILDPLSEALESAGRKIIEEETP